MREEDAGEGWAKERKVSNEEKGCASRKSVAAQQPLQGHVTARVCVCICVLPLFLGAPPFVALQHMHDLLCQQMPASNPPSLQVLPLYKSSASAHSFSQAIRLESTPGASGATRFRFRPFGFSKCPVLKILRVRFSQQSVSPPESVSLSSSVSLCRVRFSQRES